VVLGVQNGMRKLVYLSNVTVDGHIAGPAGEVDFFSFGGPHQEALAHELPETVPEAMRAALGIEDAGNKRFDAMVVGRASYEPALQAGLASPFPRLQQYVVSRSLATPHPDISVSPDPVQLVRDLKSTTGGDIWLMGGGQLAAGLLAEIDELQLVVHPVVIGAGVPLFGATYRPTAFRQVDETCYPNGVRIVRFTAGSEEGQ